MNLSRSARKRLPFLLEFFSLFYSSIDAREEKRRLSRENLIAESGANARMTPDYLSEIEEMIAVWEMHRSGELEEFAHRLTEMGSGLTLRTFCETKLSFQQDTLESIDDREE